MKRSRQPNRAICVGDRARSGLGTPETRSDILKVMSGWSTAYLKKFIVVAKSDSWKNAAVWLFEQRSGLEKQLKKKHKTKQNRKHRHQARHAGTPLAQGVGV